MAEILFVVASGAALAVLFAWAFRVLPGEQWQVLASLPRQQEGRGVWRGVNLTYYGFFSATACAGAMALMMVLLGALGVPTWATAVLVAATIAVCLPAANLVARVVEKNNGALTVAGAFAVGFAAVPALIATFNATLGTAFGIRVPWLPALAASAVSYALGEGIGRLACISFGCCYGKPLAQCSPLIRRIFARWHFVFHGPIKKAAYESGLEGVPLVPIQALTAMCCTAFALAGSWLFLRGNFSAALLVGIGGTQVWRYLSEWLRADYRGPGQVSAYQWMAIVIVLAAVAISFLSDEAAMPEPNILVGLRLVYNPVALLALQALWAAVFCWMGRSWVTESTMLLRLKTDIPTTSRNARPAAEAQSDG